MNKEVKYELKDNELDMSDSFRQTRLRYHMSQKQWADALGISYGLAKRIEAHTISYSAKTKKKVESYIEKHPVIPNSTKLNGLEEHILFDIFLANINQSIEQETVDNVCKCVRHLHSLMSNAKECSSPHDLTNYFNFFQQLLYAAKSAAVENMHLINNGKFPLDMEKELKSAFNHVDNTGAVQTSKKTGKNSQIDGQSSLFDLPL